MTANTNSPKKKWSKKKIILISLAGITLTTALILYLNFNKLVSISLIAAFDSTLISEVYDLKFENLRVDPFGGNIGVYNVTFEPKGNNAYPYINSTIRLKTEALKLRNVDLMLLLKSNELLLEKISIIKPVLELDVNSSNPILFPFRTSTDTTAIGKKNSLDAYILKEFELEHASFRVTNSVKKRDFHISDFSVSFKELQILQHPGKELFFLKQMAISLKNFTGNLQEESVKHLSFSDLEINFDSVDVEKTLDTLIFRYRDFNTAVKALDIQTKDSLFHVTMNSFDLAYLGQSIKLRGLSYTPNVSNSEIQKNYKFQHAQFSGTVESMDIKGLNFDSLIYSNKLFIEEITLDSVSARIFKDNTKSKDLNRFPAYLGQTVAEIAMPINIKAVKANRVSLVNEEKKPDGTLAKVRITKGTAEVKNITNLSTDEDLLLSASASLEDKVQVRLDLKFSYLQPQFSFDGEIAKFDLTYLNPIITAYSPAKITSGTADEVKFTGLARRTGATGSLKFLYHDLSLDLMLKDQAKWKNSIVTFGANTALLSNNPVSSGSPEREVRFKADRDMNKGFVNLIIKSILDGMKETMIMSKENRKEFNELKKETKKEARKEAKKEKN